MNELLKFKFFYLIIFICLILILLASNKIAADQKVRIIADEVII